MGTIIRRAINCYLYYTATLNNHTYIYTKDTLFKNIYTVALYTKVAAGVDSLVLIILIQLCRFVPTKYATVDSNSFYF